VARAWRVFDDGQVVDGERAALRTSSSDAFVWAFDVDHARTPWLEGRKAAEDGAQPYADEADHVAAEHVG
jgi:hypothetical protein